MMLIGHITTSHGIKGELKCYSDFSLADKIFKEGKKIIINHKEHILSSSRFHKNHYLITIDHLNDINLIENFRNQDVYINREELNLPENEYILEDLLNFTVYENEICLGEIKNIVYNKGGKLLNVMGKKSFYIPFQDYFIKSVSLKDKRVMVENTKGLW